MSQPYMIKMPQLSDTMTEGVVISWEKQIGDKISRGDVVATVETDKAIMDVEVFREGFLSGPQAPEGSTLPVGQAMAFLVATESEVVQEEAKISSPPKESHATKETTSTVVSHSPSAVTSSSAPSLGEPAPRPEGKFATPYARQLAGDMGVNLNNVRGTGPSGEITAQDVEKQKGVAPTPTVSTTSTSLNLTEPLPQQLAASVKITGSIRPMSSMEKAISNSMSSSLTMPTFRVMRRAQMNALKAASKKQELSLTVVIAKACALAIAKHPMFNSAYVPGYKIAERESVDIGMAVATPDGGLVVPVLRQCEKRSLEELSADWEVLVKKARSRKLVPEDFSNPTFMVSNMGMMGVEYFDAIPTPGTSAILAISSADEKGMPLTVTSDHRVVSGAQVAQFLATLVELIEQPTWLGGQTSLVPEGEWDYDVVVIGAGPGGQDCARHLVEHGLKVAMVNDSPLPGGECLWRGCIPSKMWRVAADKIRDRRHDAHLGIEWDSLPRLNWDALEKSRKQVLIERGSMAGKADQGMKITAIQGIASFQGKHEILVDQSNLHEDPLRRFQAGSQEKKLIRFGIAVVATGAPPFVPPIPGIKESLESGGALTSDTVWNLRELPKRIGIVGGGAIGLEMAQIFRDFGAEVVVIEMQDRILAETESEIAKALTDVLNQEERLTIHTSCKVTEIIGNPKEMSLSFVDQENNKHLFECDYVLLATGKKPKLDSLGLDAVGVQVQNGFINVNTAGRTSQANVFAVGDVIGGLMLAHTAGYQGRIAAENILGHTAHYNQDKDCGVIFTRPQAGFVGLTMEQAKEKGMQPVEMKFPMKIDAKAMITGELDGLVKMIADAKTQKIVGVHFLAEHTDTLIGEAVLMVSGDMTLEQVANAIHPHPTTTEIFGEMARRLLSRIRRLQKKK